MVWELPFNLISFILHPTGGTLNGLELQKDCRYPVHYFSNGNSLPPSPLSLLPSTLSFGLFVYSTALSGRAACLVSHECHSTTSVQIWKWNSISKPWRTSGMLYSNYANSGLLLHCRPPPPKDPPNHWGTKHCHGILVGVEGVHTCWCQPSPGRVLTRDKQSEALK